MKTLLQKIWEQHEVVPETADTPAVLYIDLHLVHEVTSPQAFTVLRERGLPVRRTDRTIATMDFVARSEVPLTPARIETLRTISRLVSQTFSRVIAEEREREQAQELQAAVDAMLETVDAGPMGCQRKKIEVANLIGKGPA